MFDDELRDSVAGYLIETALDQARADFITRDDSGRIHPAGQPAAHGARAVGTLGGRAAARAGVPEHQARNSGFRVAVESLQIHDADGGACRASSHGMPAMSAARRFCDQSGVGTAGGRNGSAATALLICIKK